MGSYYSTGIGDAVKNFYESGSGEMDVVYTHTPDDQYKLYYNLQGIMLHLSNDGVPIEDGGPGEFTVTLKSSVDPSGKYDVVIFKQDMTEITDIVWELDVPIKFYKDDEISFKWSNDNSLTWGLIYSIS